MSLSDFDRNHIQEILDDSAGKHWSSFSCHLIRLFPRADQANRARLAKAFPEHDAAFDDWYRQRGPYAPGAKRPGDCTCKPDEGDPDCPAHYAPLTAGTVVPS